MSHIVRDSDDSEGTLRLLTARDATAIATKILSMVTKADSAVVTINNSVHASATFVRNDVLNMNGGDYLLVSLAVSRSGKLGSARTTVTDAAGLERLVRTAEMHAGRDVSREDGDEFESEQSDGLHLRPPPPAPVLPPGAPPLYYDATLDAGLPMTQGDLIRHAADLTEAAGTLGAGNVKVEGGASFTMNTLGYTSYRRNSFGNYSITARIPAERGSGSGWAGSEDFSKIDFDSMTARVTDVARHSVNPVAVEPGKYIVILEPAAVAQLIASIVGLPTNRMGLPAADNGQTVFSILKNKMPAGNRIGEQMADRRMQLWFKPMDPELPSYPLDENGELVKPMWWFKDGVLQALAYNAKYAKKKNLSPQHISGPGRVRLEFTGTPSTTEDMIRSVKRGIWVHRFNTASLVHKQSLLLSGVTRDGTFLIENGKVSKPVKNFRFLESPFFVLSNVEAFGKSERASEPLLVPRLLIRDFQFTSLSDAI